MGQMKTKLINAQAQTQTHQTYTRTHACHRSVHSFTNCKYAHSAVNEADIWH